MKTSAKFFRAPLLVTLAALLFAGCLHDRLTWSPDGSRAAVLTPDGLYLSNAAGQLSPLLLPHVYKVAWLSDSQRLVVARTQPLKDFAALSAALGPDRTLALKAKAEAIWLQIQALDSVKDLPAIKPDGDAGAILLYLREHYHDALRQKLGAKWKEIAEADINWHSLCVARVEGDRLTIVATLHEGLAAIADLRPAPGAAAVAFVTSLELPAETDESQQILLAAVDGSRRPITVTRQAAPSVAWSSDGRSLLCFRSDYRGKSGDLRLGTISSYPVLDADGKIRPQPQVTDHAGVIFHDRSRLRTLPDGRLLFNAAEFHLPIAAAGGETREEFFVLSADRSTVTRLAPPGVWNVLPKALGEFEVSPDGTQILVSDDSGKVWLLTIAGSTVQPICEGFGKEDSIAPAWRSAGEFTFRRRQGTRAELILRKGEIETVLSRSWPDSVLARLAK